MKIPFLRKIAFMVAVIFAITSIAPANGFLGEWGFAYQLSAGDITEPVEPEAEVTEVPEVSEAPEASEEPEASEKPREDVGVTDAKELLNNYLMDLAANAMYASEQLDAFQEYLQNLLGGMTDEEAEAQYNIYSLNEEEALSFIDTAIQTLFAANIRQILLEALFGGGFAYTDDEAQSAVESFIRYEMDEDFVREICGWILEDAAFDQNRSDYVNYLLQVMDYQWPMEEELASPAEEQDLTLEEMNEFLLSIGMKALTDEEPATAPFTRNFSNSGRSLTDGNEGKVEADIDSESLMKSFSKTARPVDKYRTYQIDMNFEVGESQFTIPGEGSEPVDVVLVIDRSGSMTQNNVNYNGTSMTRLAALKIISKSLVKQIMEANSASRVSIVSFNTSGTTNIGLTSAGNAIGDKYNAYTGVTWNSYGNGSTGGTKINGFSVPSTTLYYLNNGNYELVKGNAARSGNFITGYYYTKSANGSYFVPYYENSTLGVGSATISLYTKTTSASGYEGIDAVWNAIDGISATGNTNIQSGILQGYGVLPATVVNKQYMILLSDGEANEQSNNTWNNVNVSSSVASSNSIKAGMLEGQWVVEQGVDLYAVGFGTSSTALERTTWSLSSNGTYKGNTNKCSVATAIRGTTQNPHTGYAPAAKRYFATNEASGLEDIFKQIVEDINITVGAVSNVKVTDILSQAIRDNFDISALAGNPASAVTITGETKDGSVSPKFTAAYNNGTGELTVTITDALKTGNYKVSFQFEALRTKYTLNDGTGLNVITNGEAGISYSYQASASSTDIRQQTYTISESPTIDVPPFFTAGLAISDEIIWEGGSATLYPSVTAPSYNGLINDKFRIPSAWSKYYDLDQYAYDLREAGAQTALSGTRNNYDLINLTGNIKQYVFTATMPDGYFTDSATAEIGLVKGKLTVTMQDNGTKTISKGLFDVLVCYDGGQFSFGADLGNPARSDSREYTIRQNYSAINATAYVPYGYRVTSTGSAAFNLSDSMQLAGYPVSGTLSDKVAFLNSELVKSITIKAEKISSPWFRDWAWKKENDTFDSEVGAK